MVVAFTMNIEIPIIGQDLQEKQFPDSSYVMRKIYSFSADSMRGRSTQQLKSIKKARKFIIKELVNIGVPAYVPDYTQNFEIALKSKF